MTLRKRQDAAKSTRSHPVENPLWKRLWASRSKDYIMNEGNIRKTKTLVNMSLD
jgi:hypothetical protein